MRWLLTWWDWLTGDVASGSGYGEFGGNGSLHWRTVEGEQAIEHHVAFPVARVGAGTEHPHEFRVRLRFSSILEATDALSRANCYTKDGAAFVDGRAGDCARVVPRESAC